MSYSCSTPWSPFLDRRLSHKHATQPLRLQGGESRRQAGADLCRDMAGWDRQLRGQGNTRLYQVKGILSNMSNHILETLRYSGTQEPYLEG